MIMETKFLSEIELSVRSKHAVELGGIFTIHDLAYAPISSLQKGFFGPKTYRELARICYQHFLAPSWLPVAAKEFKYTLTNPSPEKFVILSGPYAPHERWMLEAAIQQLGDIEYAVSKDSDGMWLWRDKKGYVEVEPEKMGVGL